MTHYSTRAAAKKIGVSLISLQRYIAAGKVTAPKLRKVGGVTVRLWSQADIQRVKKALPKISNGRHRKGTKGAK